MVNMKNRTHTVLMKQFVVVCIGVFMIMEPRNLIQIRCTEYIEDQGLCSTTKEDWLWSTRQ